METTQTPFKTSQQKSIELGQDINNTWAIIAGELGGDQRGDIGYVERFKDLFPAVQQANAWAREQKDGVQ